MGLLYIPPEIVLFIYQGLNTTTDAYNFALSCKSAYNVFYDPYYRGKIFQSILNNLIAAAAPSRAWLEACFGANTLWQPTESDIDGLVHDRTREFLLNVGFPAFKLQGIAFESSQLTKEARSSPKHYILTDDNELEIHQMPCSLAQCSDIYFHIGNVNDCMVMVDADEGDVWLWEPDHVRYGGAGFYIYDCPWRNTVAWSLDSFAMLFGAVVALVQDLRAAPWRSSSWGLQARRDLLDELRERINECDYVVAEDISGFWYHLFKDLREE
ncbi:SUKH-4 immunity protein-domain-containing protein [Aspergillus sergii]|uniref:SUKH-4 immunity protein-domain-containing protein n=1 Tax=Aspergillus sergii TaxID=1034303 RepID=A0A5N6XJC8_9EURO|nr:SUKH-4 immunity protein-domain-containing protein [Aspergillus sergii]